MCTNRDLELEVKVIATLFSASFKAHNLDIKDSHLNLQKFSIGLFFQLFFYCIGQNNLFCGIEGARQMGA